MTVRFRKNSIRCSEAEEEYPAKNKLDRTTLSPRLQVRPHWRRHGSAHGNGCVFRAAQARASPLSLESRRLPSRVQEDPSQWAGTKGKQGPAVGGRSGVPSVCVERTMGDKSVRQASREVGVPLHMGSLESPVSTGEGNGAVITGQAGMRVERPHVLGPWLGQVSTRCHHATLMTHSAAARNSRRENPFYQ